MKAAEKDDLHKVSTDLVRKYDNIIVEDLNIKGMIKNKNTGEEIKVKLIGTDKKTGKYRLSRKVLLPRPEKQPGK